MPGRGVRGELGSNERILFSTTDLQPTSIFYPGEEISVKKTTSPPERKRSIDNLFHPQTKIQKEKDLTKITQEVCVPTPLSISFCFNVIAFIQIQPKNPYTYRSSCKVRKQQYSHFLFKHSKNKRTVFRNDGAPADRFPHGISGLLVTYGAERFDGGYRRNGTERLLTLAHFLQPPCVHSKLQPSELRSFRSSF